METVGQILRQARERLGLSLDEAERTTRIRAHHLEALERDEFEALPSPVQARGFLKNYADYLGLDAQRLLDAYTAGGRSARAATRPTAAVRRTEVQVRRRGWLSADLVVAATIALGTLALLLWGGGRVMASLREATPAGEVSAFLIPSPTPQATAAASAEAVVPAAAVLEAPTVSATLPPLDLPSGQISLRLVVVQRAWVRALADGRERYRGRVEPGDVIDLTASQLVEITTGNGAALRVVLNGTDLGLLGGLDEVVTRLWTLTGEITATPTVTPTPTATPPPSVTPPGGGTPALPTG